MVKSVEQLERQLNELRLKLEEANETIEAIRTGQVDALVVKNEKGPQLYTLKTADQTYRVFIEKMNEGAVTLNKEGLIVYSNTSFANALKLSLEKVIGMPFIDYVSPESKREFSQLLNNSWKQDGKFELYLIDSNKQAIPFLLSLNTLELDEGLSMSIILTDLSKLKASQEELKLKNEQLEEAHKISAALNQELEDTVKERTKELLLSREHFKFLANNIPVIVWSARSDGHIDYFNERWYEFSGMDSEESLGWGWKKILHPDDVQQTINAWKKSITSGIPYQIEYRFRRRGDHKYRWHLGKALPFIDADGHIEAWFGTCVDIEDQKRALDKKDEFIGIASHELKTPLTSLKGYLQLIGGYKKQEVPAMVKQFVGKADEAIGKLQNLVNDLLDVSKIQKGKLQFSKSTLNITNVINSCVESANHIYSTYTINSTVNEDLFVLGNFERLEQVLMNFINNSVKYSPVNKQILVEAERTEDYIEISVTDKGIGLTESQMEMIFERFYRVDDKNFSASGLGMGLYISSEIIKAHNGSIGVESKINEGSTFYFRLPVYTLG